jgi:RNA polymerase sigma-70 factor (ECF subfamily)
MPVSTEDLIRRFQEGQSGAFDALFDRHKDYVYRVAFFITRNSGDAEEVVQDVFIDVLRALPEEVVQDVFIDVLRALPRYDTAGPARFETWLYRVTVNRCRSRFRRKRLPSADWDDMGEQIDRIVNGHPSHQPEHSTIGREQKATLWRAVDALPEAHREVVVLRYQAGLSYEEIAQAMEINVGTVKSRLYNAHKKLGILLEGTTAGVAVAVEGVR